MLPGGSAYDESTALGDRLIGPTGTPDDRHIDSQVRSYHFGQPLCTDRGPPVASGGAASSDLVGVGGGTGKIHDQGRVCRADRLHGHTVWTSTTWPRESLSWLTSQYRRGTPRAGREVTTACLAGGIDQTLPSS